ncbi:hypothetical protein QR680_002497 [Steinernema hermaphroditum]|uniref:Major facilitator superfamily (MFS) profile domain-containing protein n=1 Tax=Steinernema hermaphroditum TaxID=289476 RepID=A0AA39H3U7_9BILA|nr:hypothetical protein QR680_002497 [Steinernema hermaphroditum]
MRPFNDEYDPLTAPEIEKDKAHEPSTVSNFEEKKTCWTSIWLCNALQLLCGVQFSIYFTSMWPYLSTIDHEADIDFLGWVVAAFSVGQALSSPVFGFWSQKTGSTKYPAVCGLACMSVGNLFYAMLPNLEWGSVKWIMLGARFVTGFGAGTLGVLRAYTSNASVPKDRARAVAIGIASFVLGLSFGPAIQAMFSPVGQGATLLGFVFDVYTIPAYLMILVALTGIVLFLSLFQEKLAGVLTKEELQDPNVVMPKFDKIAAATCIFMWAAQCSVATNIEVLATPTTIVLYNWNNQEAIFYNGIMQTVSCLISVSMYFVIAFTPIGKIDRRKLVVFGLLCFISYHIVNIPWPFYEHGLDYIKLAPNSTVEDTEYSGGCLREYTWCETTARVPFLLYVFTAIVSFGLAFPFMAAPNGTLFSEVLGPRRQGMMQGIFEFFGSVARCLGPLYSTAMFEKSGYKGPIYVQLCILSLGVLLIIIFRNREVMKQFDAKYDPLPAQDAKRSRSDEPSTTSHFDDKKSCWKSILQCYVLLFLCGIQFSIYFSSMWPYLSTLDHEANIEFLGWIYAACNIGQALSSPILGFWSQKTGSTKYPSIFGLVCMATGNVFYALLPSMDGSNVKWIMLGARFITGFGTGTLGVLRAYIANASVPKDRARAVSIGIASFVLGLSSGPAIQSALSFIGEGTTVFGLVFDVYTVAAYLMIIVAAVGIVIFLLVFQENLAGVLTKEELQDPNISLPKFDRVAAATCIYVWAAQCTVATNLDVLATPTTIALYNWNNQEAIRYNGLIRTVSCLISVSMYFVFAFSPVRKISRKTLIVFGLSCFISYHVVNIPWPFYEHGLDYIKYAPNSTIEDMEYSGGCLREYIWCETTARIPFALYLLTAVISLGLGFPFMGAPNGTLYTEVLGPRRQGMMQGVFEFFGSVVRCVGPLYATALFETSGYKGPIIIQLCILTVGVVLVTVFRNRLVPMQVQRKQSRPEDTVNA